MNEIHYQFFVTTVTHFLTYVGAISLAMLPIITGFVTYIRRESIRNLWLLLIPGGLYTFWFFFLTYTYSRLTDAVADNQIFCFIKWWKDNYIAWVIWFGLFVCIVALIIIMLIIFLRSKGDEPCQEKTGSVQIKPREAEVEEVVSEQEEPKTNGTIIVISLIVFVGIFCSHVLGQPPVTVGVTALSARNVKLFEVSQITYEIADEFQKDYQGKVIKVQFNPEWILDDYVKLAGSSNIEALILYDIIVKQNIYHIDCQWMLVKSRDVWGYSSFKNAKRGYIVTDVVKQMLFASRDTCEASYNIESDPSKKLATIDKHISGPTLYRIRMPKQRGKTTKVEVDFDEKTCRMKTWVIKDNVQKIIHTFYPKKDDPCN